MSEIHRPGDYEAMLSDVADYRLGLLRKELNDMRRELGLAVEEPPKPTPGSWIATAFGPSIKESWDRMELLRVRLGAGALGSTDASSRLT